jgi:hypothetical protein
MVSCMEKDAVRRELDRAELARTRDMIFQVLAQMAETIAQAEERSAVVHDKAARYLPGAVEHAARSRRFAAAERAAATAYREHELPSDEVRKVIRDSGRSTPP